ncbi:hypothetical protein B0H14DRAFT_2815974, partial [Mycena olivaceomarginata]
MTPLCFKFGTAEAVLLLLLLLLLHCLSPGWSLHWHCCWHLGCPVFRSLDPEQPSPHPEQPSLRIESLGWQTGRSTWKNRHRSNHNYWCYYHWQRLSHPRRGSHPLAGVGLMPGPGTPGGDCRPLTAAPRICFEVSTIAKTMKLRKFMLDLCCDVDVA